MKKVTQVLAGVTGSATALLAPLSALAASSGTGTVTAPTGFISTDLGTLISWILNIVFAIGAIIALFYLIWGAFNWITSGGDKGKTADARNKIIAAIVGLILLAAAWTLLTVVLNLLGAGDINSLLNSLKAP